MTQVKRYRRGKVISGKEILQARKRIAESMKADILVPGKNHTPEWSRVFLTFVFLAILIGWFSYQKGLTDQQATWVDPKPLIEKAEKNGYAVGSMDQRKKDLKVCQEHSNIKRLEGHCVAEVD